MKIIIAGSRTITDYIYVKSAMENSPFIGKITEIVSGGAKGVDKSGERWAKENNIPIKLFPANWRKYGMSAGYRRNEEMVNYADGLVAVWDNASAGTKHIIDRAKRKPIAVFIWSGLSNEKL